MPATIRAAAIDLLDLADVAEDARYLPRWRPPARHRGRHPNVVLDGLLRYAARRGITDAELATELVRQQVQPDGPGSERPLTGRKAVTPALALRVARLAGVPMDELLAGQWLSPRVCPHCGRPPDDLSTRKRSSRTSRR